MFFFFEFDIIRVGDSMMIKLDESNRDYARQFFNVRELKVDESKLDKFLSNENNIALIEVIDDKVVALVWGYVLERMDAEPMMFIYSVDVIKEYRRRGIARKLVGAFIDESNKRGFRNSFLITEKGNVPANKLYQSLKGKEQEEHILYMFFKDGEKVEKDETCNS